MAPKSKRKRDLSPSPISESNGIFSGMIVFLVNLGVQARRLQIWTLKLEQMGAKIEDNLSSTVTHVLSMNWAVLRKKVGSDTFPGFRGSVLQYQWLEDSLKAGEVVPEDHYILKEDDPAEKSIIGSSPGFSRESNEPKTEIDGQLHCNKSMSSSPEVSRDSDGNIRATTKGDATDEGSNSPKDYNKLSPPETYNPPDLNNEITRIFTRLIDIYRALGEDRRSYSYHKAIAVIEKLPFKIESTDQIQNLPAIGKSMQDHIMEIVTTGKLSKLEHFEKDEKVRAISLIGEVWGIGPATALKLYEKGHRTLEDLKSDKSLTKAQRLGLKYFDDIKARIPRHEVSEMGELLQKAAEDVLPGVMLVCGGSYRRGKSSCGDIDVIITHPDGHSHKGFLAKYVNKLKEISFLREDLMVNTHNAEGNHLGVDTYFGLCTYPGRELRHRIDLKVYPQEIYAFGLVHWTGNDTLNRRLRLLAASKGYLLDDTGLFPATRGSDGKAVKAISTYLSSPNTTTLFFSIAIINYSTAGNKSQGQPAIEDREGDFRFSGIPLVGASPEKSLIMTVNQPAITSMVS